MRRSVWFYALMLEGFFLAVILAAHFTVPYWSRLLAVTR